MTVSHRKRDPLYQAWRAARREERDRESVARAEEMRRAIPELRASITDSPGTAVFRGVVAYELIAAGDLEGAEAEIRAAIRQNPAYGPFYGFLARLLWRRRDMDGAVDALRRWSQVQPTWAIPVLKLDCALNAAGRRTEARAAWNEAVVRDTTCSMAAEVRKLLVKNPPIEAGG